MFFYKVEGHMPKLSSFGRGKTIRPKKSLTSLLHAALQLYSMIERLNLTEKFRESWPESFTVKVNAQSVVSVCQLTN